MPVNFLPPVLNMQLQLVEQQKMMDSIVLLLQDQTLENV